MSKDKDLRREFQNWNKIRSTEFSQKNDFWTPKEVFDALNERFGPFEVDLAASDENHLVEPYFTKADNALQIEWNGVAFCNPPYVKQPDKTSLKDWVEKARESVIDGEAHRIVMLIPAYTANGYWHTEIFPYASHLVFFLGIALTLADLITRRVELHDKHQWRSCGRRCGAEQTHNS